VRRCYREDNVLVDPLKFHAIAVHRGSKTGVEDVRDEVARQLQWGVD
jgi:hypothetical protein